MVDANSRRSSIGRRLIRSSPFGVQPLKMGDNVALVFTISDDEPEFDMHESATSTPSSSATGLREISSRPRAGIRPPDLAAVNQTLENTVVVPLARGECTLHYRDFDALDQEPQPERYLVEEHRNHIRHRSVIREPWEENHRKRANRQ